MYHKYRRIHLRDLIEDTLIIKERKRKKKMPDRVSTHELWIARNVPYLFATMLRLEASWGLKKLLAHLGLKSHISYCCLEAKGQG